MYHENGIQELSPTPRNLYHSTYFSYQDGFGCLVPGFVVSKLTTVSPHSARMNKPRQNSIAITDVCVPSPHTAFLKSDSRDDGVERECVRKVEPSQMG